MMRVYPLVAAALVLLAACHPAALPADVVLVQLQLPQGLHYQAFRVWLIVDEVQWKRVDKFLAEADNGVEHTLGVHLPAERKQVRLEVQALLQGDAVAEGQAQLERGDLVPVSLDRCPLPTHVDDTFVSCLPPPADAGVESLPDAGIDLAGPDSMPDSHVTWTAPICVDPVDGGTTSEPPRSGADEAGCIDYCDAMERRCPHVFLTRARCLSACAQLAWDKEGDFTTDTLACRTHWADADLVNTYEVANRCSFASPVSAGVCGDICDVYCRMGARICPGYFPPYDSCRASCRDTRQRQDKLYQHDLNLEVVCRSRVMAGALFDRALCAWAGPNTSCGTQVCPPVMFDPQ
jgi:hypothetical protein